MQISGEAAKNFNAVRLDSFANVNKGELIEASEETGNVAWKDHITSETRTASLGTHSIRIIPRAR